MSNDTSRISFTAHYTGHVWYKNNLSKKSFTTPFGALAYQSLRPLNYCTNMLVGLSLEATLLQRHHIINYRLTDLIENHGVTQIVELACGLSPRGREFTRRYPEIIYIEADLPAMSAQKQKLLDLLNKKEEDSQDSVNHQVHSCNILEEDSPLSIENLFENFDPQKPIVVITEGLVNYFDLPTIESFWKRLAHQLKRFSSGYYFADIITDDPKLPSYTALKLGVELIGKLARGTVPLHYDSTETVIEGFKSQGFEDVTVHSPDTFYDILPIPKTRKGSIIHIVEASI